MHTKGPWGIHPQTEANRTIEILGPREGNGSSPIIAQVLLHISLPVGVDEDNARLIAAAPDLLKACEILLDFEDSSIPEDCWTPEYKAAVYFVRAAIAKAKEG